MATDGESGGASSPKPASSLSADELIRIFDDPKGELLNYKFGVDKLDPELKTGSGFYMNVPFDEIKAMVEEVRKEIFERLDPDAPQPKFEHVGSTSIRGMPGSLIADLMIIEDQFPPSASTVRAIVASGFNFISLAPHGKNDYWFSKPIPADDIGPKRSMLLHLVDTTSDACKVIINLRDACNSDPKAFEEYKNAKVAASGESLLEYKKKKSQAGIIQRLRKEQGMVTY